MEWCIVVTTSKYESYKWGLHSMAYDGDINVVVLFGGVDIDSDFKDT
jgi:hypothetical protein